MEQGNILHICVKRQVSSTLFNTIVEKLSIDNKAKLLQAGDSDGNLSLHLAARIYKEDLHICKKLIENIKQIKCTNNSSSSAEQGSLLSMLSIKNRLGKTAAHEASERGHVKILEEIWKAMSPVDQKNRMKGLYAVDHNRYTCLHLAAMNGSDKSRQYCIQKHSTNCLMKNIDYFF